MVESPIKPKQPGCSRNAPVLVSNPFEMWQALQHEKIYKNFIKFTEYTLKGTDISRFWKNTNILKSVLETEILVPSRVHPRNPTSKRKQMEVRVKTFSLPIKNGLCLRGIWRAGPLRNSHDVGRWNSKWSESPGCKSSRTVSWSSSKTGWWRKTGCIWVFPLNSGTPKTPSNDHF